MFLDNTLDYIHKFYLLKKNTFLNINKKCVHYYSIFKDQRFMRRQSPIANKEVGQQEYFLTEDDQNRGSKCMQFVNTIFPFMSHYYL